MQHRCNAIVKPSLSVVCCWQGAAPRTITSVMLEEESLESPRLSSVFYHKECWMNEVCYGDDAATTVVEAKTAEETLSALKEEKMRLNRITQQVCLRVACDCAARAARSRCASVRFCRALLAIVPHALRDLAARLCDSAARCLRLCRTLCAILLRVVRC